MAELFVAKISEWFGLNGQVFMHESTEFLGNMNIALVVLAVSLFLLRRINKYAFSNKNAAIKKVVKPLSKTHPYIGTSLVILAFLHGELALGSIFRIHTGPLVWWVLLAMMLVALIGKRFKIKNWLKVHRALAIVMGFSVLLHLLVRNIMGEDRTALLLGKSIAGMFN